MDIVEVLIDQKIAERVVKGQFLTGKQVAALNPRQHIFINGKHAVVVDATLNTRTRTSELVYVVGRKSFSREQYLDVPFNDMKTNVQVGILRDDEEY